MVRKLSPLPLSAKKEETDAPSQSADEGGGAANEGSGEAPPTGQERALTLLHLRKMYGQFCKAPSAGAKEHEQKLLRVLPLFAKVLVMYSPEDLCSQFKELSQFTGHISRIFVQEIRKRASNQSTEDAAVAIAEFLEPPDLESDQSAESSAHLLAQLSASRGWLLLYGLNVLVQSGSLGASEAACRAALPSVLAKALYLFYDLPPCDPKDEKLGHRRTRLHEVFVELLSRLCSQSCAGEELVRKDDLSLLFSGASSWCPPHNVVWRKATSQMLMIISARILTQTVIKYIHSKGCVAQFLDNLQHSDENSVLSLSDRVDMIVCLFCILKDSSNVTTVLLDDFKEAKGYDFLVVFILENEKLDSPENVDALRNLLLMFSTAVTAGPTELRATLNTSLYSLPGFTLPQPTGQGCSVRNILAFQVIERVFIKSESSSVCCTVLDVITSIYSADAANYFILEKQCTLGQFAECIHTKHRNVQLKFFELLEYVVFHLNHVPCKEFITLCVVLKTQSSTECCILCVQSCFRILSFNQILKDVFREVGILETLTWLVNRLSQEIREGVTLSDEAKTLSFLSIDMLAMLLKGNSGNARVFRECGGVRIVQELLSHPSALEWRAGFLRLVQQLLMLSGSDDDLNYLLTLLHTTAAENFQLKTDILKSLLCVLRESHRVRVSFRRTTGYLCLMSLLLSLEGSLSIPPSSPWVTEGSDQRPSDQHVLQVLDFVQLIFKVLTISMRFEPANAKFFQSEVRYDSLTISLRLTGAFQDTGILEADNDAHVTLDSCREQLRLCQHVFQLHLEDKIIPKDVPLRLVYGCYILRLLYNMALDNYEKPSADFSKEVESVSPLLNGNQNRTLFPSAPDSIIVHPKALVCIVDLLPGITDSDPLWQSSGRLYAAEVLKSLVRTERNQQVMCEAGLPKHLFSVAKELFRKEAHYMLAPFHYILERMSAQAMQPSELREFLRLDLPLCCRSLVDEEDSSLKNLATEGGPVPLSRVKALVSMMTPRDLRVAGLSVSPPFVEFDMSVEGFGCIFLPSIAPVASTGGGTLSGFSSTASTPTGAPDSAVGGVGTGERVFPSMTGLTFSTWLYVERFSEKTDYHPIRLLTVSRTVAGNAMPERLNRRSSTLADWFSSDSITPKTPSPSTQSVEQAEIACFTVQISSQDRAILISTHETDCPGADLDRDLGPSDCFLRIEEENLIEEGRWVHLSVVLARAVLKQSTASVYVNARHILTQKLHYVIQNPGGGATTLAQPMGVHATIGTPPGPLRKQSRLLWRLGTTHLLEEAWNADSISTAFRLGPHYAGSYQTPMLADNQRIAPMLAEERISFGLHAEAVSVMTLLKLRRVYSKADSRVIAKYLGISTHENATPIRIVHNTAGHLNGPARSLGGVLIGYLGIRTFSPQPVSRLLESVGGVSTLLGLIAMANDSEGLYASLKALLCVVRNNPTISKQMTNHRGYQTLAVLLKEKSRLLNSHILHLVFALIGTLDSQRETTVIPDHQAFEDLLCDLQVWRQASGDLQRLLYEHFYELITESGEQKENLKSIRLTGLMSRLLFRLNDERPLLASTKDVVFNLLAALLQPIPDNASLLRFGQFVSSTLSIAGTADIEGNIPFEIRDMEAELFSGDDPDPIVYNVYVRNRCLNILLNSLLHTSGNLNFQLCEQVVRVLGFDWLFTLLGPRSHCGTVWFALRLLLTVVSYPALLLKFKEGGSTANGGWLSGAQSVVQNRAGVLLGFSVSAHGGAVGSACDINPELCNCPGFAALQHLLPYHGRSADCYLALLSLLVGRPAKELHHVNSFELDSIWSLVFGLPANSSVAEAIARTTLCPDAVLPLLAMLQQCLQQEVPPDADKSHWAVGYPQSIMQFLTFLYHNVPEFASFCSTEEFLTSLMSILFRDRQLQNQDSDESIIVTPNDSPEIVSIHPCRKVVVDLLKNILVDSLHTSVPNKGETDIDIVLETMPEYSSKREQSLLATALLQATMDHLLASDVLICGQSASLPLTASVGSASYSTLAANVFYFTSRLVDCVWNGLFTGPVSSVFDFLLKLLNQMKRKSGSGVPTDSLVHSLNRVVLYSLSRQVDSIEAQLIMVDSLHKVTSNRAVIFSPTNNNPEFLGCLTHLLFMLSVKPDFSISENAAPLESTEQRRRFLECAAHISNASHRVWEELYLAKKQVLEDKFKTALVPEINAARALVGDAASQHWQTFVDAEIRGPSRDLAQIQQQLQSKIQKVATGIQRLASRKSTASTSTPTAANNGKVNISREVLHMWTRVHISLIRELFRLQAQHYAKWHEHVEKWCLDEWHHVERELTRERGLWGPDWGSKMDKWMLDSTEGPCRSRRKLVPNPQFYIHYPYRPNLDLPECKSLRSKVAISRDSKGYYEQMKTKRPRILDTRILDTSTTVSTPSEEKTFLFRDMREVNTSMIRRVSITRALVPPNKSEEEEEEEEEWPEEESQEGSKTDETADNEIDSSAEKKRSFSSCSTKSKPESPEYRRPPSPKAELNVKGPDNQTLLRLLEEGEELHSMFRCARIEGLESSEGLLLFGKEHYYVVDGYTLLKTREIRDLDFLPHDLHDPIVPYTATGSTRPSAQRRQCSKFAYEDISEVHKRRYLLQPIALEVFSTDGRNYLLAFPKKMRNRVHAKFISVARALTDGGHSVSGQRSSMSVEQTSRSSLFSSLIGETSVTQRWVRGETSNFQYLMHLNTLAGRSYNDLSQYPVFPWVLADYENEELDLTEPSTFRDLAQPMGAQTPTRLEQFLKRYREWDDPSGDTLPYMYGTHYSSAMIVVSYLVRVEPFTQQFLKLQGGHFDLADRMFHSIKDAWMSASKNNMADVKELIPEFFYLPDFLNNANKYDLGVKQNGIALNDVLLPPWAKGDAREFVRLHREALESDYVSLHLHEWIDLIFGYKQQGQASIDASNLFHHLFYEGNVDFEAIEDPLTRNATIGFINNFGQIPAQLFKKPHPQKKLPVGNAVAKVAGLAPLPDPALPTAGVTTERFFFHALDALRPPAAPVKELKGGVGEIFQNEKGQLCAVEQNKVLQPPNYSKYLAWGFADRSLRLGSIDNDKSCCIHEFGDCGEIVCVCCPNNRTVVTGSTNTVVCVWELVSHGSRSHSGYRLRRRKSLYGHTEPISCIAASGPYGIVVSGSQDGTCIVWDLSRLSFIRQLGPHQGPVTAVQINHATGDMASASGTHLSVWSINGERLAALNCAASPKLDSKQLILSLAFSTIIEWDPTHVIVTGSNDGVVRCWSMEFIQVPKDSDENAPTGIVGRVAADSGAPRSAPPNIAKGTRVFTPELLQERLLRQQKKHHSAGSSLDTPADWSQGGSPERVSPQPAESDSGFATPVCERSMSINSMPAFPRQQSDDSLVFVNRDGLTTVRVNNKLRTGMRWQRQLVFRHKLTMHTAFERKDNGAPAAITTLAISRDHKSVYVGDSRGRVWQWLVGEGTSGGRADHWVQDPSRNACAQCSQKFSLSERKHHCRNCGQIFCARCSRFESEIRHMKISKPVRVCQSCFLRLKAESS